MQQCVVAFMKGSQPEQLCMVNAVLAAAMIQAEAAVMLIIVTSDVYIGFIFDCYITHVCNQIAMGAKLGA